MKIKELSKYSVAEKIVLVEQLWDSVTKENIEISEDLKNELDVRLQSIEEETTEYYTWNEVKNHLKEIRK